MMHQPPACLPTRGSSEKDLDGDSRICLADFLPRVDDVPDELCGEICAFIYITLTWLAEHLANSAPDDMAIRRADAIYAAVARVQLTACFARIAPV